ncbi:MAG: Dna2/Cas4 domain-containing protein, partial [bacterium]
QILAYAYLLEMALGLSIQEGRIRYHADNVLVHVTLDDEGRQLVRDAIARSKYLQASPCRPPVTDNERLCGRCSLSTVCLPEEARLAHDREWQPVRLFPKDDEREVIHVLEAGTSVGKKGEQIKIVKRDRSDEIVPAKQ